MGSRLRCDPSARLAAGVLVVALVVVAGGQARAQAEPDTSGSAAAAVDAQNGSLRTVPFITLRNKTGATQAAEYFGHERNGVTSGYCDVSHTPLEALQPIAKSAPFYVPDERLALASIREQPLAGFWSALEASSEGRRPVLYTHGYYISFERGCKRASLFQHSMDLAGRFVLFSWPSDGAILNYTHDESDLYWSVAHLAETLADMVGRFGAGGFDVVAHSLGTRGVMLALVRLSGARRGAGPLIHQLVLLAPDIDAGIFEQNLPLIRPLAGNITIYASSHDKALALSRQIHGYARLGEAGAHLEGLTGVEIIDLSDIGVRYPSGHLYHLHHATVVSDLKLLLNDTKSASQRPNLEQVGRNHWRLRTGTAK